MKLWNVTTGSLLARLTGQASEVTAVAFGSEGERLAAGSHEGKIKLWSTSQAGPPLPASLMGHASSVTAVAFSPNGKILASAGDDNKIRLWDAATGQPLEEMAGATRHSAGEKVLVQLGDTIAKLLAHINFWSEVDMNPSTPMMEDYGFTSVAFSPDGHWLAAGSRDDTVKLWDRLRIWGRSRVSHALRGHTHWVTSVAFSPDGKRLVSGSKDATVKVWEAATARLLLTLERNVSITLRQFGEKITEVVPALAPPFRG